MLLLKERLIAASTIPGVGAPAAVAFQRHILFYTSFSIYSVLSSTHLVSPATLEGRTLLERRPAFAEKWLQNSSSEMGGQTLAPPAQRRRPAGSTGPARVSWGRGKRRREEAPARLQRLRFSAGMWKSAERAEGATSADSRPQKAALHRPCLPPMSRYISNTHSASHVYKLRLLLKSLFASF